MIGSCAPVQKRPSLILHLVYVLITEEVYSGVSQRPATRLFDTCTSSEEVVLGGHPKQILGLRVSHRRKMFREGYGLYLVLQGVRLGLPPA